VGRSASRSAMETTAGAEWVVRGGGGQSSASPIDLLLALRAPRGLTVYDDVASEVVRSTHSSFNKFARFAEYDRAETACVMLPRDRPPRSFCRAPSI
jgi:hypothetical protein